MLGALTEDVETGVLADEVRVSATAKRRLLGLLARTTVGLLLVFALFPFWMMVLTSFKNRNEIARLGVDLWPNAWTFENYVAMWTQFPLEQYYLNSLVIAGVTTVLSLTIAGLAAYSFSRYEFPFKSRFELAALATQMIPGILILIPMFLMYTVLGRHGIPMADTYWGMIFLYTTFTVPFAIWMLRGYIDTIPRALEEAAQIDGCTRVQALYRIVVPLAMPGFAATGMFVFLLAFNEVMFASVLASENVTPFAIGIMQFQEQGRTLWGPMMAASTVAAIPLLFVFLAFQKQIVSGLTSGSVKQ